MTTTHTRTVTLLALGLIALTVGPGTVAAQVRAFATFTNEAEGYKVKVPRKWDAVPARPEELSTLNKWRGEGRGRSDIFEMQVLRFEPQSGTTASGGGEIPAAVGEDDESLSVAERVRRYREATRPRSFGDWLRQEGVSTPLPEPSDLDARDLKARLYVMPDIGRGHGMMVGVYHDGTFEWAVVYTAPSDEIVNPKRPTGTTSTSSAIQKSLKSFRVTERKIEDASSSPAETTLEKKLEAVKKKLAPGWQMLPTPSGHYVVVHNIPQKKTRLIAFANNVVRYLDQARERYEELFPPRREVTAVSVVRVCASREEYLQYGAPPSSAGYWSAVDEELVIYEATTGGRGSKDAYSTLFHEAFHQYIYYAVGEVSPHSWFNEGYGDYFAGIDPRNRFKIEPFSWRTSVVRTAVDQKKNHHLKDLVRFTQREYYTQDPGMCYAQGWALVYYLNSPAAKRDDPAYATILGTYFDTLVEEAAKEKSTANKKALEAAFDGLNPDLLERLNEDYVKFIRSDFR